MKQTHAVGCKQPNVWGLHDMHGNVWEWCHDEYGVYLSGSVTDPTGPASGSHRVRRGGGWRFSAEGCRAAYRGIKSPDCCSSYGGFRVCLSPAGK
ncbi:formylglycine-generating enzyme family protein [Rubripirellula sp.]|nr:formylglycine-generating enzyme family protein [Rubripirellula sp.]MDB4532798.1 formylglycine-generating enzyme family protein [bacterium]MDB4644438.1 formylglycine-generating enzyme family protein [Rubripirellula sp.]